MVSMITKKEYVIIRNNLNMSGIGQPEWFTKFFIIFLCTGSGFSLAWLGVFPKYDCL